MSRREFSTTTGKGGGEKNGGCPFYLLGKEEEDEGKKERRGTFREKIWERREKGQEGWMIYPRAILPSSSFSPFFQGSSRCVTLLLLLGHISRIKREHDMKRRREVAFWSGKEREEGGLYPREREGGRGFQCSFSFSRMTERERRSVRGGGGGVGHFLYRRRRTSITPLHSSFLLQLINISNFCLADRPTWNCVRVGLSTSR